MIRSLISFITIALYFWIRFQTGAALFLVAITNSTSDKSASGGAIFATMFLIAGIIGFLSSAGNFYFGIFLAGVIYIFAGIIGLLNIGVFGDLIIWSILSILFGLVFIFADLD